MGGGGGNVVLFRGGLDMKIKAVFLDSEGKLVVLNWNGSDGGAFKLLAPIEAGQSDYFKRLDIFLRTSRTFLLVGVWDVVLDERSDCMSVYNRRRGTKASKSCLNVLKCLTRTD